MSHSSTQGHPTRASIMCQENTHTHTHTYVEEWVCACLAYILSLRTIWNSAWRKVGDKLKERWQWTDARPHMQTYKSTEKNKHIHKHTACIHKLCTRCSILWLVMRWEWEVGQCASHCLMLGELTELVLKRQIIQKHTKRKDNLYIYFVY